MQNEAQYDLDRKGAKISALPSNNLDRYEYLTGEHLGLKPSTIEQAKCESSPLGKVFNKGLDKDDQKEGLFKKLKNIENTPKNKINSKNEEDDEDKDKKNQQNKDIGSKPLNVFNYLKALRQKAKKLLEEIEWVNDDTDVNNLAFFGSNREKFDFNTFKMPLNFLSDIHNSQISLKEAEFKQRDLERKIEEIRGYKLNNAEEEIDGVLMQANDMLEYRNKIIKAFKDGTFLSEHLKISDDAANKYVLKDVNKFIQKIKSMSEKIYLSLFREFFSIIAS